MLIARSEKKI